MTRIARFTFNEPVRYPLLRHPLVGYALIAFALAVGHACIQGFSWNDPVQPDATYAIMTSAYLPGSGIPADTRVGLDGMVAPMSLGAAPNGLQQPLLINNTECGLYAVSRELRDDAPSHLRQLSI